MLRNKIYKYLSAEIFKNFITILLTFTAISWTVKAVNFLDLMIEDGFSVSVYFKYSILNISSVVTRFVPLSFLLSMIISIVKFEREKELLILWTTGLNKIKIVNVFFLIGFLIAIFQIILGLFLNPYALDKSRDILRETESKQVNSIMRSNDFSDTFKGVTFYIDRKTINNELINIFIKDSNGSLNTIFKETDKSNNTTIIARRGTISGNKLILFNGTIQTLNEKNEIKNINFQKTELNISNFSTRTITQPKIQETSSLMLLRCLKNDLSKNCTIKNNKKIIIENLSRRLGMPLYIPLISILASFLLIQKKEKKYNYLKKHIIFGSSFTVLVFAEILLKYTGFSLINFVVYFASPFLLLITLYFILIKKMNSKIYTNE